MSGKIIIQYELDDHHHRDIWDESVNIKYILRVLEFRKAQNIKIRYI